MSYPNPFTDAEGHSLADEGQPDFSEGKPKVPPGYNPATTKGSPVNVNNPLGSLDIISLG